MMDYERLTRRNQDGTTWVKCVSCYIQDKCDFTKETCCQELQDRLAELEDKIEQGTLIELPCKVGDTVYEIETSVGKDDRLVYSIYETLFSFECLESWDDWYFLTLEEAEKRLKELQE